MSGGAVVTFLVLLQVAVAWLRPTFEAAILASQLLTGLFFCLSCCSFPAIG